ncbi:unnamed protein product [Calicophoron daubneyi]|uniref:Uncharacterized protein n=1 Tax=Calicophoron daubneyi TaxID=300641 RepID=A0AAV2SYP7_CALDB
MCLIPAKMSLILSTMILLKSVNSWEFNSEILCDGNLTRFTANSKQEVIHFLFAASSHVRPPSLLVLYSPLLTSEVTVQCENFVSRNFTLSKGSVKATSVTSAYGVLFYQFRYYRDVYDKATVPVVDENPFYFASNLDWQLESCDDEPDAFSVSFAGKKKNDPRDKFLRKGKIKLKLTVYKKDAKVPNGYYYTVQPNREVQVQVIMDKLNLKSKEARVAPVIFLYSNKPLEKNDDFLTKSAYALNAFTGPLGNMMSIYVILNGQTKHVKEQEIQSIPGFIHFPPIACSQVECADQSAVLARLGDRVQINRTAVKKYKRFTRSLAHAYFGDKFGHPPKNARMQFVNLGTPGDGFYNTKKYLFWHLLLIRMFSLAWSMTFGLWRCWPCFLLHSLDKQNSASHMTIDVLPKYLLCLRKGL